MIEIGKAVRVTRTAEPCCPSLPILSLSTESGFRLLYPLLFDPLRPA